ncbi:hypothetical protein GJ744_004578 [Endocarpon pusillum]|uniref:Uncharacterized protein n=1 Tax=Endocarpon pusillum TaxID=364733 RepID=A0A8H7E5N4_9EURO|nr:hypothetical protein GJ744_004578 [Endocarpon pusillum]
MPTSALILDSVAVDNTSESRLAAGLCRYEAKSERSKWIVADMKSNVSENCSDTFVIRFIF